jgi:apolipoprotein N-acyltransferase
VGPVGRTARVALAALSGVLYTLAEPGWGVWPLAFVCLAPLVFALCGCGPRARAGLGWIMGTTAALGTIGPTLHPCATLFFGLGPAAALGFVAAVAQLFGALPVALFAWLCGDPRRGSAPLAALRVASAWTAQEWLRTLALTGLPWTFLAHALAPVPALIQGATLGGAFLVSFWLAALNAAGAVALAARPAGPAAATAAGIAGLAGLHALVVAAAAEPAGPLLRARLVQANVPEAWRGTPSGVHQALARLVDLTRRGERVDLAIWPENAVSVLLPLNDLPLANALRALGGSAGWVVLGAPRVDPDEPTRFRNSAFLVDPAGAVSAVHDKVHLVPFAEYAPWPLGALGLREPGYVAGERPGVLRAGSAALGPLVCYEVIFPAISRALVRDGASVLMNVSNDYWLGPGGGREQHLAAAVFRAVEFARPMLRATNTGITAAIDGRGRILARLDPDVAGALTVAVRPASDPTPYARTGDAFAWLATAVALAGALPRRGRARSAYSARGSETAIVARPRSTSTAPSWFTTRKHTWRSPRSSRPRSWPLQISVVSASPL